MAWTLGQPPPPLTQPQLRTLLARLDGFTPEGVFRSPYSFLIDTDGVDYYASNAFQVVYGGPDDAGDPPVDGADPIAVIQAALNGLTAARTIKETVFLRGNLGNIHDVIISDYTRLVGLNAKVSLAADQNYMWQLGDSDNVTDIDLIGIDHVAAQPTRTANPEAIIVPDTFSATNVKIKDCSFIDFISDYDGENIPPTALIGEFNNLTLEGNIFKSTTGDGGNSYNIHLVDGDVIKIRNNYWSNQYAGNHIYTRGLTNLTITSNFFVQEANWATAPIEAIDLEGIEHCTISDNIFKDISVTGILFGANGDAGSITDLIIKGNHFNRCGYLHVAKIGGIAAKGSSTGTPQVNKDIIIAENVFNSCDPAGIRVSDNDGESSYNNDVRVRITNNWFSENIYALIAYGNAYDVRFTENTLKNNTNKIALETGTFFAKDNDGYVTENYGRCDMESGASKVVSHGLDGLPKVILLTSNFDGAGDIWADTESSTQFTIHQDNAIYNVIWWHAIYDPTYTP